ncbi:MAG TPA: MoaD/ThiS family protein [Candidatus Nanoarchaeia archaeon]|nr:MoaD/ThiS family protein [Candidatus Nanoarchaeia archaeon]
MELVIKREREQSREKISFSGKTVKELLLKLKLNPETVLVVRKEEVLTEDELVKNKDEIEILSVVSGG